MWWRFIAALGILALILGMGVFVLWYVDGVCQEIGEGLALSVEAILATGRDETPGLANARRCWDKSLPLFCTYVIHDQVDMVNETFQRALGQMETGGEEYLATLRELQFWIGIIQNYDRPTVRSIF